MKCVVRGCNKTARYVSPDDWCGGHWNKWWTWPEGKKEPKWMNATPKSQENRATLNRIRNIANKKAG